MTARPALGEEYGFSVRSRGTTETTSSWKMKRKGNGLLPEVPRYYFCNHQPKKRALGIAIKVKGESSFFSGVYQCGMPWVCPICAPRIAEVRRTEIQQALDNAIRLGYGLLLVTFTFPHGLGDVLQVILDKFTKAQEYVKSGRAAAERRARIGYIGEIRTLEVTHGVNGWHPHVHSVWVMKRPMTPDEVKALEDELYQAWRAACLKSGLPEPSREHGVDIRSARHDVAQYVAKWGFSGELAYTTRKRAKQGGRTPMQLLADAANDSPRLDGEKGSAAWLWREFALAFFGKRQLFWSKRKTGRKVVKPIYVKGPLTGKRVKVGEKTVDEWIGLREELKLTPELTDQQILDLEDELPETVAVTRVLLDLDTWHVIRKSGEQETILKIAKGDDIRDLYGALNYLRSIIPMEDGKPPGPREDWMP